MTDRQEERLRRAIGNRPLPIREEPLSPMLYHYTSVEGLLGILDNRTIWVTKSDFLNDYSELVYLRQVYAELLDRLKAERDEMAESGPFYRMLKAAGDRLDDPAWLQEQELFVLSLTHHGDSYTMWSNFSGHHGYNIQIDCKALIGIWESEGIKPLCRGMIVYDREEQAGMLYRELQAVYRAWQPGGAAEDGTAQAGELVDGMLERFKIYGIFFKDACFLEEREYRIVFTAGRDGVKFRLRNGAVIPYIEVPAGSRATNPIYDITIGPKLNIDIAEKGMAYYLRVKGYEGARVIRSRIPLRY